MRLREDKTWRVMVWNGRWREQRRRRRSSWRRGWRRYIIFILCIIIFILFCPFGVWWLRILSLFVHSNDPNFHLLLFLLLIGFLLFILLFTLKTKSMIVFSIQQNPWINAIRNQPYFDLLAHIEESHLQSQSGSSNSNKRLSDRTLIYLMCKIV